MKKTSAKISHHDYYTEKAYNRHVRALGQAVLAWNSLYEVLAIQYSVFLGGGYINEILEEWHSLKSDDRQRTLLLQAITEFFSKDGGANLKKKYPTIHDDFLWIIEKTKELQQDRNDIVHAPIASAGSPQDAVLLPATSLGNPRAKNLYKKRAAGEHLLKEYKWCRVVALTLRDYAERIGYIISGRSCEMPNRPELPLR